ncbi:MAG: asparaginase [Candidatus Dormiibacterota bacterium]
MPHSRVTLYTMGGTIASLPQGQEAATPRLQAADLVAAVPELAAVAELAATTFRQVPSPEITVADLLELRSRAEADIDAGAAGVVVTQGTDTLEESAFLLDLLWTPEQPLVLTAAMRTPDQPGADGPANLLAAVRVAGSESAHGLGCLVVMSDQLHAARFVRKVHTTSPDAFASPLCGPIGWVTEGRLQLSVRPARRRPLPPVDADAAEVPVALLRTALGDDGRLLPVIAELGYRGLVVEATGGGHLPRRWVPPLEQLTSEMPVVLASRTGTGAVLHKTYGFPGSETDLLARGLLSAGVLDGLKARLLLTLLLMAGAGREQVARFLREIGST